MIPLPAGASMSSKSPVRRLTAGSSPARSRLASAARTATGEMSLPKIPAWSALFSPARARHRAAVFQAAASNLRSRLESEISAGPAATPSAICAASIRKVPLPHIGSSSVTPGCQPLRRRMPAARFSFSGASTVFWRQAALIERRTRGIEIKRAVVAAEEALYPHVRLPRIDARAASPKSRRKRSQTASLMRSVTNSMLFRGF
jgi:hypothetical protein